MTSTVLAADHAPHAGRRDELGERGEDAIGFAGLALGEEADRLGEQAVAGEDRDVLAVDDVRGRPAAAQLVVVHRRQVVVDQRIGVDELDRRRRGQHPRGSAPSERAVARQSTGRMRLPPASSE